MKKLFLILIFFIFKVSYVMAMLDQDQILEEVNKFLLNENQNLVLNVNNKIKIPNCYGDIQIKNKYRNLKTLEILCIGEHQWKYNLRTNIDKNLGIKKKKITLKKKKIKALVSIKRLKRGHILSSDDLKLKYFSHIGSNNTFANLENLIGRRLKVSLKEEQIIRERHLIENWLIKEGQKVKIEHKRGNLTILVDGVALKSGMLGDYLEVKNENSGTIIKGWVKNNKKITIFR